MLLQSSVDFCEYEFTAYVGRRLDLVGISPPKKIWIAAPPFRRVYLDQNNPPLLEIFEAKTYRYPPLNQNFFENFRKILDFWSRFVRDIPPFKSKKSIPLQKILKK